jgi:hypothetical protein
MKLLKKLLNWLLNQLLESDKAREQILVKSEPSRSWDGQIYPDLPGMDLKKHISGQYISDDIADDMFKQGYGMYILKYNEKTDKHRILVMRNVQEKNF